MPAGRILLRPLRFALALLFVLGLLIPAFSSRTAGQGSPAQGSAQVIAQGLTAPPADRVAWRVVQQPIPERLDARPSNRMQASAGFLLADETAVFVADQRTKLRSRLAPGEAQFIPTGANQTWANLEDGESSAYSLELVDREVASVAADGEVVFRSGSFSMDPGDYDMDLIRDDIPAGERAQIERARFPVLIFVTSGRVEVTSSRTDDRVRLSEGQATSMRGEITIRTRGDDPATYVAAIMGDPVSGGEPVPTPVPTDTPEPRPTREPRKQDEAEKEKRTPGIDDGSSLRVAVRLCPDGMTYFAITPSACERADGDFQLALVDPDGNRLHMSDASRVTGSFVRWSGLEPGEYVLVVGTLPDGYISYSLDGYVCCSTSEGWIITIGEDQIIDGTLYVFQEEWGVGGFATGPGPAQPAPAPQQGNPAPGADSDGDGLSDELELNTFGTSPQLVDSDGDTIPDGVEAFGTNGYLTAPALPDTDRDGVDDNVEIQRGTNPLNPGSR